MNRLIHVLAFLTFILHSKAEIRYIETSAEGISTGVLKKSFFYVKTESEILETSVNESEIVKYLTKQVDKGSTLVFYSCSFLGNVEPYLTQSIGKIRNHMLPHPYAGPDATLIVLFRPFYAKSFVGNHTQAYKDGLILGPVLEKILNQVTTQSQSKPEIKILAHSMGNRFLEGIFEFWTKESPSIAQLILAAPDIAQDTPIKWATSLPIRKVTLYTHSADMFLGVSTSLLKSNRAGKLLNNKDMYSKTPAISVVEVRNVAKFPRSIDVTGHVYFLFSSNVRKDIQREIHNIDGSSIRKLHPEGYFTLK